MSMFKTEDGDRFACEAQAVDSPLLSLLPERPIIEQLILNRSGSWVEKLELTRMRSGASVTAIAMEQSRLVLSRVMLTRPTLIITVEYDQDGKPYLMTHCPSCHANLNRRPFSPPSWTIRNGHFGR